MNYYNYFTEIEETFIRRRGKNLMLSPLDWALMESWQEREVPLHIVLRGIEKVFDTFDKQPNRVRTIKSLSYCKEEVEAQFVEWLETQVGKNLETSDAAPESAAESSVDGHVAESAAAMREAASRAFDPALAEVLERVAARLDGLKASGEPAEILEQSLEKLDAMVDEALLELADEPLVADVERRMAEYRGKMETDVFARTYELMIVKQLRERHDVPRLSLFFL